MKNCLIFYSNYSGRKRNDKKINFIKKSLLNSFNSVDVFRSDSIEEFASELTRNIYKYHTYIICGGDGTFNFAVNTLMNVENRPTLAYLNLGTLGDVGVNFGIIKNLKDSLQVILDGNTKKIDVGLIGNKYFIYMASNGAFSEIASKSKKTFGKLSYYIFSIPKLLKKEKHTFDIKIDKNHSAVNSSFIMVLNGANVGGFNINKNSSISDGVSELFYSSSTFLNGIPSYLLKSKKVSKISIKEATIKSDSKYWCLDGEIFKISNPKIKILKNILEIYSK